MNIEHIGSTNIVNITLGLIVVISFFLLHFAEMASFGSRIAGKVTKRVALGTTLQLSIVTMSRFFLIPFLPVLAYLVESGIIMVDYLVLLIFSFFLTFISSAFILFKLNIFQLFFQKMFVNYDNSTIPKALFKTVFNKNKNITLIPCPVFSKDKIVFKKMLLSFLAYLFLVTGFFIAFMLGIIFPENRLTLSQLTAFFHGFGAIIVAVYLDPMLSRSMDIQDDEESWTNNSYSIILGRVFSYLFVLLSVIILLFFQI